MPSGTYYSFIINGYKPYRDQANDWLFLEYLMFRECKGILGKFDLPEGIYGIPIFETCYFSQTWKNAYDRNRTLLNNNLLFRFF